MHLLATDTGDDRRRLDRGRSRPDPGRYRACCRAPTPRSRCSPRHRSGAARKIRPRRACASRRSCGSATISRSTSTWRPSPARGWSSPGCSAAAPTGPTGSSAWSKPAARAASRWRWCPGDDKPDPELAQLSTLAPEQVHRLWRYLAEGGPANADNLLRYAGSLIGYEAAMGGARGAAAGRAALARSRTAEPRRDRRGMARYRRDRADRVLPGARPIGQHRAGRCAGPSPVGTAASAAADFRAQPQGWRKRAR